MSLLQKIQPFVQSVAEAIAAAMKIEVEIVDNQLFRVGGTGILLEKVGAKQERGYVDSYVIKTSTPYVVETPGDHWLCSNCDIKGRCFYTAGIFCPITLDGKAIGLISLISFNESQRQTILSNVDHFTDFITKMSDLLAGKASEFKAMAELRLTSKHLETIINSIREGIIAVDHEGTVSYMSSAAEKILKVKSADISGRMIKECFPSSPLVDVLQTGRKSSSRNVIHRFGKHSISVVSSAYPIKINDEIVGAVESFNLMDDVQKIAYQLTASQHISSFDDILGNSKALRIIKERAAKVADGSSTVLITGESGTGKELFARAIHQKSPRLGKPFVSINCSAIPDSLLESELFGYEEGAFTGAKHGGKPGKFELADGGSIFLDEIGEMPLYLQAKLLRVLQERKIERLGGLKSTPIDVRVIAATNKDLSEAITKGEFRPDLYFRLSVIPLSLPPLREMKEDIPCLISFFLEKYNNILEKDFKGFSPEAKALLMTYSWPGNVRELENTIEYSCNMETTDIITLNSFPERLRSRIETLTPVNGTDTNLAEKMKHALQNAERQILLEGLERFGRTVRGKEELADHLGIGRATLYRRLKELEII
jgi:sigma-54 dependent transcriptional regulator, acetoin dehydrogenase operon transcriptional activator AcoR